MTPNKRTATRHKVTGPGGRRTETEMAHAVGIALVAGPIAASAATGINESTIRHWWKHPKYDELRERTHEDVAEQFWVGVQAGIERIVELLPHAEDIQKVAVAVGILYDKRALIVGGATARTESRDLNDLPDSAYIEAIREARRLTGGAGAPAAVAAATADEPL